MERSIGSIGIGKSAYRNSKEKKVDKADERLKRLEGEVDGLEMCKSN